MMFVSSLSRLDLISSSSLPSFYGKIRRSLSAIADYSISFYVPSSLPIRRLRMCVGWSRVWAGSRMLFVSDSLAEHPLISGKLLLLSCRHFEIIVDRD
jgi:hypothetical protein